MRRILFFFAVLFSLTAGSQTPTTQVRCATFNIRYANAGDAKIGCGWDVRGKRVADFVLAQRLDLVGMQEVLHSQLQDLLRMLPEYDYVGVGRTDGRERGEFAPILFRRDRYEVMDKGNFWLSEHPEQVGVKGWDAALERIASWVKLRDRKTQRVFMMVNTHFDHVGHTARQESAKLIMRKIEEIVGTNPAFVTGDFNITEADAVYQTMVTNEFRMLDAFHITDWHHGTQHTFHDFCRIPRQQCVKIDFIFVTPNVRVTDTFILPENADCQLSDHNPHWADLVF
ncbi:MAG: endonuclease/exonuclease/phosphatase family protein [Bacteroidaceae bacterium]|nr:endonuclease/exonuclease/phosphatase family protein [Bacteroidaceae bacterium]